MDAEVVGEKNPAAALGKQFKSSVTVVCFGSVFSQLFFGGWALEKMK